jgi:hypothetical protein
LVWERSVSTIAFNGLYGRLAVKLGRPVSEGRIELAQTAMAYTFDPLRMMTQEGDGVYLLSGWGFPTSGEQSAGPYDRQVVLLDEDGVARVFHAEPEERPDVKSVLPDLEVTEEAPGFRSTISADTLDTGVHQIGLLYTREDGSSLYALTRWYLKKTPNTLQLMPGRLSVPDPLGHLRLRLGLAADLQPMAGVAYHVDSFRQVDRGEREVYELTGWCYPEDVGVVLTRRIERSCSSIRVPSTSCGQPLSGRTSQGQQRIRRPRRTFRLRIFHRHLLHGDSLTRSVCAFLRPDGYLLRAHDHRHGDHGQSPS